MSAASKVIIKHLPFFDLSYVHIPPCVRERETGGRETGER
jgi:hypothetical protein